MTTISEWQARQKYKRFSENDPGVLLMPGEITDDILYEGSVLGIFRPCARWNDRVADVVMLWHIGDRAGLDQFYSVSAPTLSSVSWATTERLFSYLTMKKAREISIGAVMVAYEMVISASAARFVPTIWFEDEADAVNFAVDESR